MKNIIDSGCGVFVEEDGRVRLVLTESEDGLEIKRFVEDKVDDWQVLQIEIINETERDIKVNSIVVADFLVQGKVEKVLENGWGQSSFAGYRTGVKRTRRRMLFLKRDQNPYSFKKSFGYLRNSMVNEWFTQVVLTDRSLVFGAVTTEDQFSQVFLVEEGGDLRVRITCQLDGLILKPGEKIRSEKIAILSGIGTGETLAGFADLIKKYSKTRSVANPPVGLCCAYYYQGNVVSEEYLLDQIRALSLFPVKTDLKYIQIDAGYCVWGDWLEINESFPSGMKKMAKEIKKIGLKAGIWFAPFVASPKSKLYLEHKDWFLKDKQGIDLEGRQSSPIDFLPSLSLKVLDPTLPEVQKYLKKVVEQFLEWGFEMLKVDFTYPVCFAEKYSRPQTRAQALRTGFQVIREASGEKVHLLSAISQLSPLVGMVDSARVGIDTINPYVSKIPVVGKMINNYMFKESMRNSCARLFLNGKVWINDADCFVGRQKTGLTKSQIGEQFDFIKNNKEAVWIGDSFKTMSKTNLDKYIDLFKKRRIKKRV